MPVQSPRLDSYFDALDALPKHKSNDKGEVKSRNGRVQRQHSVSGIFSELVSENDEESGGLPISGYDGQRGANQKDPKILAKLDTVSEAEIGMSPLRKEHKNVSGNRWFGKGEAQPLEKPRNTSISNRLPQIDGSGRLKMFDRGKESSSQYTTPESMQDRRSLSGIEEECLAEFSELEESWASKNVSEVASPSFDPPSTPAAAAADQPSIELSVKKRSPVEGERIPVKKSEGWIENAGASRPKPTRLPLPPPNATAIHAMISEPASSTAVSPVRTSDPGEIEMLQPETNGVEARNRWRRVKHTLAFAHHMSQNVRANSSDFLDHGEESASLEPSGKSDTAGRAGAAAFEGAKIKGRFRAKGRKGMEGMIVKQDKSFITLVQDFYVACLKMPIAHFLIGVFFAPILLGLIFTPIYLLDRGGLAFDGVPLTGGSIILTRVAAAKQKVSALLNVFLYALSLSTTFGGSPLAARSPYCLSIANVNTLMGQFLFVFLSGAVFARMSQPSHPIRCSKVAIIRPDDFTDVSPSEEGKEKSKVFAVRLVLTGPAPCELVDAKICLTFRIFIKLPSGSMFCSTQDLDLVRPEVSYLRYGIMVRHIIDSKSPVYGHTLESLLDGDASFSLTVMGLERASMQPIFHLEDYFVCDGDVAYNADYVDFIHINKNGHRVLDHSKIDLIKTNQDTKIVETRKENETTEDRKGLVEGSEPAGTVISSSPTTLKGWKVSGGGRRKMLSTKSSSFIRA